MELAQIIDNQNNSNLDASCDIIDDNTHPNTINSLELLKYSLGFSFLQNKGLNN